MNTVTVRRPNGEVEIVDVTAKFSNGLTPAIFTAMKEQTRKAGRATEEPKMAESFPIGTRVQGGRGDDHDIGTVIAAVGDDASHPMANGPNIFVAWQSGVRTWTPIADLEPA